MINAEFSLTEFYQQYYKFIAINIEYKLMQLPKRYAPNGIWNNETIEDFINEYITEHGWNKKKWIYILQTAVDEKHLKQLIKLDIAQFISDTYKKDECRKIYKKINNICIKNPSIFISITPDFKLIKWGLINWIDEVKYFEIKESNELIKLISNVKSYKRKEYNQNILSSPIIEEKDLKQLLQDIFNAVKIFLSVSELLELVSNKVVIIKNFNEKCSFDQPLDRESQLTLADLVPFYDSNFDDFEINDSANKIINELTDVEKTIFKLRCKNFTYEQIGEKLDKSKSYAELHYKNALQKFAKYADEYEEIVKIHKKLVEFFGNQP